MGHPLGPGRSGSGADGDNDQSSKPTTAARIAPVTKMGEVKEDIMKTGGIGGDATADDVVTRLATTDLNTTSQSFILAGRPRAAFSSRIPQYARPLKGETLITAQETYLARGSPKGAL
jgi:hypothetical protein